MLPDWLFRVDAFKKKKFKRHPSLYGSIRFNEKIKPVASQAHGLLTDVRNLALLEGKSIKYII